MWRSVRDEGASDRLHKLQVAGSVRFNVEFIVFRSAPVGPASDLSFLGSFVYFTPCKMYHLPFFSLPGKDCGKTKGLFLAFASSPLPC